MLELGGWCAETWDRISEPIAESSIKLAFQKADNLQQLLDSRLLKWSNSTWFEKFLHKSQECDNLNKTQSKIMLGPILELEVVQLGLIWS